MKKNLTILIIALLISVVAIAQKNELKNADKALKKGDLSGAKAALESVEGSIGNAEDKYKSQFYFLKGKMYFDMAKKQMNTYESFDKASEAFNKVIAIEEAGKKKYTGEVREMQKEGAAILLQGAQTSFKAKDYKEASRGFEKIYRLSPVDTSFLYNAAVAAVAAKDYNTALKYYEELRGKKYIGRETVYTATNQETGEVEQMPKQQRDLYVKAGTHTNPEDKVTESKRPEIIKNIAYIYIEQGKNDEALRAIASARAESPDDVNLILNEANIHMKLGDKEKFKALMEEAVKRDSNNPDLHYNIGVVSMEQGQYEAARAAYKKALSINPQYVNAVLNLSTSYINEGNDLIEEMNELATKNNKAANKKYDELKDKKDALLKQGAEVLENSLKDNPGNTSILEQLKNIYGALGDNENYMRVKKILEQ